MIDFLKLALYISSVLVLNGILFFLAMCFVTWCDNCIKKKRARKKRIKASLERKRTLLKEKEFEYELKMYLRKEGQNYEKNDN